MCRYALAAFHRAQLRSGVMESIEFIWSQIVAHRGDTIHQKRGKPFTYAIVGNAVSPSTTNRLLPKSDFNSALGLMPLRGPGEIQHLQGPSYIYAILMDERIGTS